MTVDVYDTSFDASLVASLRETLADSPYLAVIEDHAREQASGTVGESVSLIGAVDDAIIGLAHAQETVPNSGQWFLDVIPLPSEHSDPRSTTEALVAAVRAELPQTTLEWWTRGDHVNVADSFGVARKRTVRRMALDLAAWIPPPAVIETRPFTETDGPGVVEINNTAFAGHPDRSSWTVDDVHNTLRSFNDRYEDLLLAPQFGVVDGFCWCKQQSEDEGEIFVLATHPRARGTGLGGALLQAGLAHLREDMSASVASLFVEAENERAIAIYEEAGFVDDNQPLVSYLLTPSTALQ